jgi:hypothetical protein
MIIVSGTIVVAGIGWFSNYLASRFENARLITNLQIQREEAETTLRGVIFDQTMKAFLSEGITINDKSKQLLQLELLALNFGDTVSLTPLFVEFRRDLNRMKANSTTQRETIFLYHKRLRSLAKRVASQQFSSLALHGTAQDEINIRISRDGASFINGQSQFVWPREQVESEFGITLDEAYELLNDSSGDSRRQLGELIEDFQARSDALGCMQLDGATRKVEVAASSPNGRDMWLNVQLRIWDVPSCRYRPNEDERPIVAQNFTLDFFNFPKIDNTRLTRNQRFALIMESYDQEVGKILMAAVIFPSEYASLSDRPGMKEAIKIMQDAMNADQF